MAWRLLLPAAFGLSLGAVYALSWSFLERAWTPDALAATAILIAAGILAGIVALWLMRRLNAADSFTRFAGALLILPLATTAFAAIALFAERLIYAERAPLETWLHQVWWVITIAASAVLLFLAIVGRLMLPFGVVLTLLFAVLFAARPGRPPASRRH